MTIRINLLSRKTQESQFVLLTRYVSLGSVLLYVLMAISSATVYFYWHSLAIKRDTIVSQIGTAERQIASFRDVEIEKSIITAKVQELQKIHASRFDYVQGFDDVQRLFGYTLAIDSLQFSSDGTVEVTARKQDSDIRISKYEALASKISFVKLNVYVSSSTELQKAIESIQTFYDGGVTGAVVRNTQLTEDGGYLIELELQLDNTLTI